MNEDTNKNKNINRRDFMKGTVAGMGVAAAPGSALFSERITRAWMETVGSPQGTVPQISPSQVKETVGADVVVIGVGISGACAALSAIEGGAKTVLLEKEEITPRAVTITAVSTAAFIEKREWSSIEKS